MKQSRQRFFVGMDGGGTKIKLKLADKSGKILAQAVGGPAQIRFSVDQAWASVHSVVSDAFGQIGQDPQDPNIDIYACLGLAGCELVSAKQDFLSQRHYFKMLLLHSDAYVACVGAHGGNSGGIVIVGTGVIGFSIVNGISDQVGGWGFPHDDMGGGAWLGLQAFRRSMQAYDGRLPSTWMTNCILEKFNRDHNELIQWSTSADSTAWASLAPIVIDSSKNGHKDALDLLKQAAAYVSQLARSLINKHHSQCLPLAFFGGISPFIMDFLDPDIIPMVVERKADAEDGALWLIQQANEV